jgi:hypothetical protein
MNAVDQDTPWANVPKNIRYDKVGELSVDRDIETRVHSVLDRVRARRLREPEPSNVLVTGETGVGKSKILQGYIARPENQVERLPDGRIRRPVFNVEIRTLATPRSTAVQMLKLLGLTDRHFHSGSVADLTERVKHHMIEQGVELCTLDEFNNTLSDDGRVRSFKVAMWVKDLCKSKTRDGDNPNGKIGENIPFAMIGTPKSERIVDPTVNNELASLTPFRMTISRYEYDTPEAVAEFRSFLDALDEELPFDEFSELGTPDENGRCPLADKIHMVTYGLLRPLGFLIREAANMAIEEGAPRIFERHLFASVEDQLGLLQSSFLIDGNDKGRTVTNPFTPPDTFKRPSKARKAGYKEAA